MNIFNLSFGKDSMATLILAAEQGIPIDRVMYCEIKFNDEISAEHPVMAEWIPTAEKRLKELFGVTVDHAYSGVSFYEQFYKVIAKGNRVGDRVVTVKKDSYHEEGWTGTVVGFDCTSSCSVLVRFDKRYNIHGGSNLNGILPIDSKQGVFEYTTDIKVIHPILGYIPEPEKPAEVKKYTDTAQVVIEKIRNLLTF